MSYAYVQAKYTGSAGSFRQLRALTVHMAEGGGTVSWLTHPTNANSSHFVIEYSGRIVQMVRDDAYDFSLHIARPYGAPGVGDFGTYSLDVAKAVLGLDGIADPNRYMYAVELEGFAAAGPNAAQVAGLKALIADLHRRYPTMRGLLGHRDFQNYKPCPGGKIPWASLGGHGLFAVAVPTYKFDPNEPLPAGTRFATTVTVPVYDPLRPGRIVANILPTAVAISRRIGIGWSDGASRTPNGYPFVQISEGPFTNCVLLERDGRVVLPAPPAPVPVPAPTPEPEPAPLPVILPKRRRPINRNRLRPC